MAVSSVFMYSALVIFLINVTALYKLSYLIIIIIIIIIITYTYTHARTHVHVLIFC